MTRWLLKEGLLAYRLDLPVSKLRRWREEGRGPRYLVIDGEVRYHIRDVRRWLDEHRVDGAAGAMLAVQASTAVRGAGEHPPNSHARRR